MKGLWWTPLLLLLVACGGSREDLAVTACEQAIAEKLSDKNFRIDAAAMRQSAKPDGEDVIHIKSGIVFDPGLPREYAQTFDCKARFTAGKSTPDVISLSFTW